MNLRTKQRRGVSVYPTRDRIPLAQMEGRDRELRTEIQNLGRRVFAAAIFQSTYSIPRKDLLKLRDHLAHIVNLYIESSNGEEYRLAKFSDIAEMVDMIRRYTRPLSVEKLSTDNLIRLDDVRLVLNYAN